MSNFLRLVLMTLIFLVFQGCTSMSTEQGARTDQPEAGPAANLVEGFLVVPEINFAAYKKIIVAELKLDNIINPESPRDPVRVNLSADQQRFYRDQYIGAVVDNLIADGAYTTALDADDNVLLLSASIVHITPPEQQEKPAHNSAAMQAISGRTSTITIALELYDSTTRQMVATFTDTRELGQVWDENNPMGYNMQVPLIFDYWLAYLRKELDELSGR